MLCWIAVLYRPQFKYSRNACIYPSSDRSQGTISCSDQTRQIQHKIVGRLGFWALVSITFHYFICKTAKYMVLKYLLHRWRCNSGLNLLGNYGVQFCPWAWTERSMTFPLGPVIFCWPPPQLPAFVQHLFNTAEMAPLIWLPEMVTTVFGARLTMQIWALPWGNRNADLGCRVTLPKFSLWSS